MSIFDEQEKKSASTSDGTPFEKPPAGTHSAVLIAMIDLGTHEKEFKGKMRKNRKIFLVWELVDEFRKDKTPHVIGREYNLFFGETSALTELLETWLNKKIPPGTHPKLTAMLGRACNLTVVHKQSKSSDREYANIDAVTPLKKGEVIKSPARAPFFWDLGMPSEPPAHDWLPYNIGEPLVDWIKRSPEWRTRTAEARKVEEEENQDAEPAGVGPKTEDDIPF
jgi:hypothetical protein